MQSSDNFIHNSGKVCFGQPAELIVSTLHEQTKWPDCKLVQKRCKLAKQASAIMRDEFFVKRLGETTWKTWRFLKRNFFQSSRTDLSRPPHELPSFLRSIARSLHSGKNSTAIIPWSLEALWKRQHEETGDHYYFPPIFHMGKENI